MIEWLESIDRAIVLAVNGMHTPVLDEIFWFISASKPWIPLYVFLLYLVWKQLGRQKALIFLGIALLTIAIVDATSVYFFKETFQRARPSHHALLTHRLHFYPLGLNAKGEMDYYKGGDFGFISSHASNFFALTLLVGLSLKRFYPKLIWILLGISVIVCFSRLYLGVHYLSDVVCGALWGSFLGYVSYRFLVRRYILTDGHV